MGKFKAEAIIVRKINGLEIVFWDDQTIYLRKEGQRSWTIFHRWFAKGKIDYEHHWKLFRQALFRNQRISYLACFEVAAKFGVLATSSDRELNFKGRKVFYKTGQ